MVIANERFIAEFQMARGVLDPGCGSDTLFHFHRNDLDAAIALGKLSRRCNKSDTAAPRIISLIWDDHNGYTAPIYRKANGLHVMWLRKTTLDSIVSVIMDNLTEAGLTEAMSAAADDLEYFACMPTCIDVRDIGNKATKNKLMAEWLALFVKNAAMSWCDDH